MLPFDDSSTRSEADPGVCDGRCAPRGSFTGFLVGLVGLIVIYAGTIWLVTTVERERAAVNQEIAVAKAVRAAEKDYAREMTEHWSRTDDIIGDYHDSVEAMGMRVERSRVWACFYPPKGSSTPWCKQPYYRKVVEAAR